MPRVLVVRVAESNCEGRPALRRRVALLGSVSCTSSLPRYRRICLRSIRRRLSMSTVHLLPPVLVL
jgi:hypothetical protein